MAAPDKCFNKIKSKRTELLRRSDDSQIVLQPTNHRSSDGHGALTGSEGNTNTYDLWDEGSILLWVAQALNHKMRILGLDADPVPPVHKKQVCLDPVCSPQWSEGRDPTSQAAQQQKQKKCLKRQHGCNVVLQVQIFSTVPWVQCFAGENSQSHTWNTPTKRQFALRDKSQKVQEVTHVFLAWPSWKHIWPTRAADWSPRHCYRRK